MENLNRTFLLALFISLLFHIPLLFVKFDFRIKKIKTENVVVFDFSETGIVAEKEVAHKGSPEKIHEVKRKEGKKKEKEKERKREKEKKNVKVQKTKKFERKVVKKKKIEERKKEVSRVVEKEEESLQKVKQNTEKREDRIEEKSSGIQSAENVKKEKMKTEQQILEREKSNVESGNVAEKSVSEGEAEKGKPVVSTNKKEFNRESYVSLIIREIERKKFYPPLARRLGVEGKVVVRIVVDRGGKLKEVSVVKSSGNKILDRAALKLIKKCDFPPLPPEYQKETFDVEIPIRYELK
ncbi:TonB family protein [Desulfurobacterium crinifex]